MTRGAAHYASNRAGGCVELDDEAGAKQGVIAVDADTSHTTPLDRPEQLDDRTAVQGDDSRQFFVYQIPFVKGVSILGVVAVHVTGVFRHAPHYSWVTGGLIFANTFAKFAAPLFVLMSGFYLSLNQRNEKVLPFYRRTLRFLLIPFFVYSLVYSIPAVLAGATLQDTVRNFFLASASDHLWFAPMIVELYLLHPFLARLYRKSGRGGLLVLLALLVQLFAWPELRDILEPAPSFLAQLLYVSLWGLSHLGYFVGGYFLLEHSARVLRLLEHPASVCVGAVTWLLAAAALAALVAIPMSRGVAFAAIPAYSAAFRLLWPLLVGSALATILALRKKQRGIAAAIALVNSFGLYSYGVYYLHPVFISLSSRVLQRVAGLGPEHAAWYVLLFALACLLTLSSARFLARLPLARFIT